MKFYIWITLLVLSFTGRLYSQVGFAVDIEQGHASNVFSNYRQLPDSYTAVEAQLNYDWLVKNSGFRLFYRPDFTWFQNFDYRSYQTHNIGTAYYVVLNQNGDKLTAGVDYRSRSHSDDYQWFEYRQVNAYVGVRLSLANQLLGYAGLATALRNYSALTPFSHRIDQIYLRISRFFDSGTTIITEANLLQKQYSAERQTQMPEGFPTFYTDGMGDNRQFVALVRLAQSLSPNSGISSQFLARRNMANTVRYLVSTEGDYYSDEELFDDVFGFDGEQYSLSFKQRLPWKMTGELALGLHNKRYINRYAFDLEGYPFEDLRIRRDQRQTVSLSLTKPLRFNQKLEALSISLDFAAIVNRSNDPYYHYRNRYFSLSLSQKF